SQSGDSNYAAAVDVVQAFTVNKAAQTITFGTLTGKAFGDASFNLSVSVSSSLAATFASSTLAVCTVSGSAVTIVAPGSCSITASQAGDSNYTAASDVVQAFTVNKAAQTITFGTLNAKAFGDADFGLSATASSLLTPSFASTTTSICTVSGSTVTIVAVGSCSITASQEGDTNYNAATDNVQAFAVGKGSQTITFGTLSAKTFGDADFNLTATASSSLVPTFASTTAAVCTVSGNSVAIIAPGNCSLTAFQAGDANYASASDVVQAFTVNKAAQSITFVHGGLTYTESSTRTDGYFGDLTSSLALLSATASSSLPVTVTASPSFCAHVNGQIQMNQLGDCVFTMSQAGNANYQAAPTLTLPILVNKGLQTISFAQLGDKTYGGAQVTLSATALISGYVVSFRTSSAACSITGNTLSIVSAGTCVVEAYNDGWGNDSYPPVWQQLYEARTASSTFAIAKASQSITFGALADKVVGDGSFSLTGSAASSLAMSYASTTASVCTVSGSTVTLVAAGSCSITASQVGDGN
ncbi:MAG: hypothetical protein MJK04_16925, partial [Psychrosphaera sp.]|nr:hypothetical protein [Psychrosphaera sp.]